MLKTEHATVVANVLGEPVAPWSIERVMRATRSKVKGLPEGFRFHDLRHFASLLIASGADVKVVQTRLRHGTGQREASDLSGWAGHWISGRTTPAVKSTWEVLSAATSDVRRPTNAPSSTAGRNDSSIASYRAHTCSVLAT